jgi:uncharacterized protein DUF5947
MSTTLAELARRSGRAREPVLERCELCGEPMGGWGHDHRHLLDLGDRELKCACRACALLFDRPGAAAGRYRTVGDRHLRLDRFALDDTMWEELRLPVDIAFFFLHSGERRVMAFYPSPMGPTESLLRLDAWERVVAANPVLETMEPDVEALLVDRALGSRRHWLVPIDACYGLVGLIRTHWKGLTGGKDVWQQIGRYFDDLDRRSQPVEGR